jgi:hypothetical protein
MELQGQTRLKLNQDDIDIVYSGRGMPFRCHNIITLRMGVVRLRGLLYLYMERADCVASINRRVNL